MTSERDPFDRVKEAAERVALDTSGRQVSQVGRAVAPIPANALPPAVVHKMRGDPSAVWTYTDAEGAALFHVARFDAADGSKAVLPLTLWRVDGRLRWEWKAFPGPRPLYGLQGLAQRPSAPVLIVEGEKTADAASERFAGMVVVTWPGGSMATRKADWSPIAGRTVVVWPDADDAGRKAAHEVARCATAAGAAAVAVVHIPDFLPPGWDLADAWLPGFGVADAETILAAAMERGSPSGVEWPKGFRMEVDGLWYDQPTQHGGVAPTRLSAPFEVIAEARDAFGEGWAVVVRFKDRDGREKTIPVLRARLASGGAEVRAELAHAGLIVSPARGKADKFLVALAEVKCGPRMTLVSATGWAGPRFVLPSGAIGPVGDEPVLFTGDPTGLHYGQKGSLGAWSVNVAAKAEGNPLLTFALSLAFLGPLLRLLDVEGGGVHFRGASSSGKTTLAIAAGSVWGGPGYAQTWRATNNAMETIAWGHNDGLLVLDELALVAPEEAGMAAYSLASGQSKGRARTDGSLRRRSEWRDVLISTGEISLADHIQTARWGGRPMAGQELRLLDLSADAGRKMGVWEVLHLAPGPAELSDAIRQACEQDYGLAGPAFVEHLVADKSEAISRTKARLTKFLKDAAKAGDSGQAQRAAVRFGAAAVAGELAAEFGIVPWPLGWASVAALLLYAQWAAAFGRDRPREEQQLLRQIRAAIESKRAAFAAIGDQTTIAEGQEEQPIAEARSLVTLGYRRVRGSEIVYFFHDQGWAEVTRGFDPVEAARVVDRAGFLVRDGDGRRYQKSLKIKGEGHKLYCVKADILVADLGD